jgi:hypothetical protein
VIRFGKWLGAVAATIMAQSMPQAAVRDPDPKPAPHKDPDKVYVGSWRKSAIRRICGKRMQPMGPCRDLHVDLKELGLRGVNALANAPKAHNVDLKRAKVAVRAINRNLKHK